VDRNGLILCEGNDKRSKLSEPIALYSTSPSPNLTNSQYLASHRSPCRRTKKVSDCCEVAVVLERRMFSLLVAGAMVGAAAGTYTSSALQDKVIALPYAAASTGGSNFSMFSGYLSVGNNAQEKMIHYIYTESQSDPTNDPIIFWTNGLSLPSFQRRYPSHPALSCLLLRWSWLLWFSWFLH
jgi:hypothetical protein